MSPLVERVTDAAVFDRKPVVATVDDSGGGEVFGPPGTVATITYLDVNAQPQRVDDATLPWAYDTTTTQPAVFVNVSAQGNSDSIGCRIKIDDVVKDERTANTLNAYTYCLDKSG